MTTDQIQVTIDPMSISQALHKRIAEIAIGEEIAKAIASACESFKVRSAVEDAIKHIVAREINLYVDGSPTIKTKIRELVAAKVTDDVVNTIVESVWKSASSRW